MTHGIDAKTQRILNDLSAIIEEVMGADVDPDKPITMETRFGSDLELESIEFVAIAERIQKKYGQTDKLIEWFATKDLDQMIALTVGDLVRFLAKLSD